MNIFTDTLFLFAFILTLLYFNLPDISDDLKILHKLYLFLSISSFYFLIQLIKKIRNKCEIDVMIIFQKSIYVGLICILGYSTYIDFTIMKNLQPYFVFPDDKIKTMFVVALTIVGFYLIIELVFLMFMTEKNICT